MLFRGGGIGRRFKDSLRAFAAVWSQREPAVARARLDSVDRRSLRVPHRRLRLRVRRRGRRRGRPRSSSRGSYRQRSSHRSPGCSATATRESGFSCSRTSRAIVLVGARRSRCSRTRPRGSSTGSRSRATIATTPFRSSQAALTPSLARTPEELTAANAVASGVESIAVFAGPALAGVLLAVASTGTVFLITAAPDRRLCRLPRAHPRSSTRSGRIVSSTRRRSSPSALAGFTTLARNPPAARHDGPAHRPDRHVRRPSGVHRRHGDRAPRPRRRRRRLS